MSNGADVQCCAADICCGGAKGEQALTKLIRRGTELTDHEAEDVAHLIREHFTLVPKSYGLSDVVQKIASAAREHPYES